MNDAGLLLPVERGPLYASVLSCRVLVREQLTLSDRGGVDACLNQDC